MRGGQVEPGRVRQQAEPPGSSDDLDDHHPTRGFLTVDPSQAMPRQLGWKALIILETVVYETAHPSSGSRPHWKKKICRTNPLSAPQERSSLNRVLRGSALGAPKYHYSLSIPYSGQGLETYIPSPHHHRL